MQMWDKKAIIKRLKTWRETNNLSTRKFALNAGIDPAHYAKVETGKMLVTESMLVKIFEKYSQLNKSHILYGTEDSNGNAEQPITKPVSAPVSGITALEVAAKIIGLAPPVNPDMPAAELYQHFVARENKYLLAYDLLKQTITELAAEVKMLKEKMDS